MEKKWLKVRGLLIMLIAMLSVEACSIFTINAMDMEKKENNNPEGEWDDKEKSILNPISFSQNSQYLTIQDSNPVNTITVRITHNDSGATVFENVYPKGQTSLIVIPMNGWSAGSYTIELFGRENNGYLWGTFQVLP